MNEPNEKFDVDDPAYNLLGVWIQISKQGAIKIQDIDGSLR